MSQAKLFAYSLSFSPLLLGSCHLTEHFALRQTSILSRGILVFLQAHLTDLKLLLKGSVFPHVVSSPLSESKTSDQAIEVRLGPQGVKAKYVRVELRKIETIPGVPPNSYYDFVGQSPVNLWRSSEEYSMLHS
ncbi:hypothetical protein F5888DRAFT_1642445, partial [Russula emetica]